MEVEIIDQYFDVLQISPIVMSFEFTKMMPKNHLKFNFSDEKLNKYQNASSLQKLYLEFKNLDNCECKIKSNGIYEERHSISDPAVDIFLPKYFSRIDELHNLLETESKFNQLFY
jgi:hypothetical protein